MITNAQLRETFVSAALKHYFDKKLAPLAGDEVDARVEETLKFLNMAAYITGNIPVSQEIDEVWHYWILQTEQYRDLCAKLNGGRFVHHTSNDYEEYVAPEAARQGIDLERETAILCSYVLNYGELQAERVKYWPFAQNLMRSRDWDIGSLNAWLKSAPIFTTERAAA
jgi:hypothetical protein